jgi:hypothetical protein
MVLAVKDAVLAMIRETITPWIEVLLPGLSVREINKELAGCGVVFHSPP